MLKKFTLACVAMLVLAGCSSSKYKQDAAHEAAFQKEIGSTIFFKLNSDCLNAASINNLEKQVQWLKNHPMFKIKLEGHADVRGTKAYNIALGERRAATVKHFMIKKGIDAARISVVSYGKERPIATGHTSDDHARNRRVVTVIK